MPKLIIDTDPGQDIDDLLVLWFALLRPELDIRAITTVTWPSDGRARLVKRLLRYLGRTEVPVGAGMQLPLRAVSAEEWKSQQDLARVMNHRAFAEPHEAADAGPYPDAVELIIRTVEENAGDIALACIGPLTNIATALRRRPEIAPMIRYIALMGGETALNRREHNIAFDYTASEIVLTAGIPLFMGTWDVTRRFTLSMDDMKQIGAYGTPLHAAMAQAVSDWHPAQNWKPGPVMYDLFPIAHSIDPSYYTLVPQHVHVETAGEATRGMTIVRGGAANAHVTTAADAPRLRELYLNTICPRK